MATKYDKIGIGYGGKRQTDPEIATILRAKIGDCKTLLNVGAGTGSYEPADCNVVAIEPSIEMIKQRRAEAAPAIIGIAEDIPFADKQFDVAQAVLTIHHWANADKGLGEMLRVTKKRLVLLTFDPDFSGFWLEDYIPELFEVDRHCFPSMDSLGSLQSDVQIEPLLIPHNCLDGFLCANWRRPEAYLDPEIRSGISTFSIVEQAEQKLKRLEEDLATGAWAKKYSDVLAQTEMDLGYRLVTVTIDG